MSGRQRITLHGLVILMGLSAAIWFALQTTNAPSPAEAKSDSDFSNSRAMAHVRAIASETHPAGSKANERVRQYLIDELSRLGLTTEVQTANVVRRTGSVQTVNNLIARMKGSAGGGADHRAIMLAAHYDSVAGGPGAADDTAGVAALLETARAIKVAGMPKRDIIFLITDGEEMGLLGARGLFEGIDGMALKPQIALAINFEARGTAGPSIMFETAPHNLSFIRHFAAAAPYPIANSLSYDVYRLLPNDTDFTIFRWAGLKGLNFAMIGNYYYYHTKNDSPENLAAGSLWHHGSAALSLARHFANLSDDEISSLLTDDQPNAVYFNLTPTILAIYPAAWVWPLTILQFILTTITLIHLKRRRLIAVIGIAGAAARLTLALLITPLAVFGLMHMFSPARTPAAFNLQLAFIAILSTIITLSFAMEFRRFTKGPDLAATGLLLFSLLSIPINIYVPGGSFLTLWPTLFATAGLFAIVHLPPLTWLRTMICLLAALPAVLMLVPMDKLIFTALTLPLAPILSCVMVLTAWMLIATLAPAVAPGNSFNPARQTDSPKP